MAQIKQALTGAEALQILETSASIDLKRARQLVEEAATADIASYFKGADLGEISPSLNSTLVSAAIAGASGDLTVLFRDCPHQMFMRRTMNM